MSHTRPDCDLDYELYLPLVPGEEVMKNTRVRLLFSPHLFRGLPLPACFTTEQSTVEAFLFFNHLPLMDCSFIMMFGNLQNNVYASQNTQREMIMYTSVSTFWGI